MANISLPILRQLVDFSESFKRATLDLEKNKLPTFHLVAKWRELLMIACDDDPDDDPDITELKHRVKIICEKKFDLNPRHVVAAMLDPSQKKTLTRSTNCRRAWMCWLCRF